MSSLLIKNIGCIATPIGNSAKYGNEQNNITTLSNSVIVIEDEKIIYVGEESNAPKADTTIDANGSLVTPGLVDAHTHLVFGGWRQHELEKKLNGVPYLDILKEGGGILSTVKCTRLTTKQELLEKANDLINIMAHHGTTTVEAKSGYGLSIADELKQLEVIAELSKSSALDIVPTFMGAHAVPEEYKDNKQGYIDYLCKQMIPKVAESGLAEFCDIFCETGVFDSKESKYILEVAKSYGFEIKIHADEIDPIGGGELAGEIKALSAEHLIAATDEGIKAMAKSRTIGVLLPCTSFYLDKPYARARKMLEEGMSLAVATDFNPGSSPNLNLQFAMTLACLKYKLNPKEVLTAVTLNAAAAINRANIIGSIEVGKQGDIVIWNMEDLNYLFYRYGNNQVKYVIKKGQVLFP